MNLIRIATAADAPALVDLYAPFILHTGITQETEVPSIPEFAERITDTLPQRPWLVCEINGVIAGYAYAGKYRDRKGYQWSIEPSVYIHEKFYRHNIATALYTALFEILKMQGFVNAYAVITLPNEKSIRFHKKFGFADFTIYRKVGYKLNQWHDVAWLFLQVNEYAANMKDPIPFSQLNKEVLSTILENGSKQVY